jgi:hypothetical protein
MQIAETYGYADLYREGSRFVLDNMGELGAANFPVQPELNVRCCCNRKLGTGRTGGFVERHGHKTACTVCFRARIKL